MLIGSHEALALIILIVVKLRESRLSLQMGWQKSIRLDCVVESVPFGFMAPNKGNHYSLSLGLNSVRFNP